MATMIGFESYQEATENYEGFCKVCKGFTRGECEPDAREYPCPDCGNRTVYGAEEACMMGLIEVGLDEDDFPDDE